MTRDEARTAIREDGFLSGFSSPGRPELWVKGKERMALALEDGQWRRIRYPEPATATPDQVRELAKRDGIVLRAGVMPNPDEVTVTSSAGTEGADGKSASDGAAPEQRQCVPTVPATDLDDMEI